MQRRVNFCKVFLLLKEIELKLKIEISGISPLLMHRFIESTGEKVDKNITPRDAATKCAYLDEENKLYYPLNNIFACIIEAGRFHKNGKGKVTTARSSIVPAAVSMDGDITYFSQPDNFEVDSRSVVNPSTGGRMMSHRAALHNWKLPFSLSLDTKIFTEKEFRAIVDDAGSKCGLGDFRPARKGLFGRFVVTEWKQID